MKLHILLDELMSKHNNPFMMKYERLDITSCYPIIMHVDHNFKEGVIESYRGGLIESYQNCKRGSVIIK